MDLARLDDGRTCVPPRREMLGCYLWVVVFPNMNRLPSDLYKLGVVHPIPRRVGGKLLRPPCGVRLGLHHVLRTRMPKAAVNEHRYPQPGKYEIGSSWEIASMKPETNTATVKRATQSPLGSSVLRPLARHEYTDPLRRRLRTSIRPTDHGVK